MGELSLEDARIVFESYNLAIEQSFDRLFNSQDKDVLKEIKGKEEVFIAKNLKNAVNVWSDTALFDIGNKTPRQYFWDIEELDCLIDMFKLGAVMCDEALPHVFIERLRALGEKSIEMLLKLAIDKELVENEEDVFIAIAAVRVLGQWKAAEAIKPLLDVVLSLNESNELYVEELCRALSEIGEASILPVVNILDYASDLGYIHEHLLGVLADIGKRVKSEVVYKGLKNAFVKMENKIYGAIYLGEYGDGRAIPALRGYIEKNRSSIDRDTFYQIVTAIHSLGGDIEDIREY